MVLDRPVKRNGIHANFPTELNVLINERAEEVDGVAFEIFKDCVRWEIIQILRFETNPICWT